MLHDHHTKLPQATTTLKAGLIYQQSKSDFLPAIIYLALFTTIKNRAMDAVHQCNYITK